jgi:hypothetical protein
MVNTVDLRLTALCLNVQVIHIKLLACNIVSFYQMMIKPYQVLFIILFAISIFTEFLVFNEEVLLALCFLSFVVVAFNFFNDTVFDSLAERASKFEAELLSAFKAKHTSISYQATQLVLFKSVFEALSLFETLADKYNLFIIENIKAKQLDQLSALTLSTIFEISLSEKLIASSLLKSYLNASVYPIIFSMVD